VRRASKVETTQVYEEVFPDREQAPKITCHVLADTSNAPKALAAYAKAEAVDLMCIGTRGLGAFRRSMYSLVGLGSVSDWLVHNSECPVLVCKLPPEHVPAVTPTPDRCAHGTLSNNRSATECLDSVQLDDTDPWSKAECVCSQPPSIHARLPPSVRRNGQNRSSLLMTRHSAAKPRSSSVSLTTAASTLTWDNGDGKR
jgi:hypothetical protein